MKNLLFIVMLLTAFCNESFTQASSTDFTRKGKFIVEAGYNLIGGITSGTGISLLSDEGTTLYAVGFDMGTFLTEKLALKGNLSILGIEGDNILSLGIGPKYYIANKIPIDATIGFLNVSDSNTIKFGAGVGYAIKLADNILLEPNVNINIFEDSELFGFKASFVMLL